MDSFTTRVSVVIVILGCLECSYVYFSRRAWQISNGIRKETWEKQTILQCFQFDANDTNSRHIYLNNGLTSLNCETAGKDHFLQALTEFSTKLYDNNHILSAAYCVEKKVLPLNLTTLPFKQSCVTWSDYRGKKEEMMDIILRKKYQFFVCPNILCIDK